MHTEEVGVTRVPDRANLARMKALTINVMNKEGIVLFETAFFDTHAGHSEGRGIEKSSQHLT